jgi:hypothetical protein
VTQSESQLALDANPTQDQVDSHLREVGSRRKIRDTATIRWG